MDIIQENFIELGFSIALAIATLFIGILVGRIRNQSKCNAEKDKAVEEGILSLLRAHIMEIYDKSMERGFVHIHTLENVLGMYEKYHTLGGNGTVTKMIKDLEQLPIR